MIPYGRQHISQDDIDAVVEVLKSDWLTQGPTTPKFEDSVASYCHARYAVAANSATSALHIACAALGLGPTDWLWTSATTFVASANCALYCGANVDFVDIDQKTYNLSVEHLAEKLNEAEKLGRLPKIVVPVHLCGQPCDMERIHALSKQYGFKIVEDASHAIGGKYKDEPIGNCAYSDIAVLSFHPVKIITTGEGGMAITNCESLARRLRLFRSHGITSEREEMHARPTDEIWNYQQIDLGFNYRMTDIQAALGLSQIDNLDYFVAERHQIANRYDNLLKQLPLQLPWQHTDSYSSYHLYPIRVPLEGKNTQLRVYNALIDAGIRVNLHYIPVYRQPYYEAMGFKAGYCVEAENYYKETISLPMYPTLTEEQQEFVISSITETVLV